MSPVSSLNGDPLLEDEGFHTLLDSVPSIALMSGIYCSVWRHIRIVCLVGR